jgi:hypothetical protein
MTIKVLTTVRPDAKGRITLGRVAEGVSSYRVCQGKDNCLILEPLVEIPAREKWLFDNEIALNKVKRGLKDSAANRVKSRGGFAHYKKDDDTE